LFFFSSRRRHTRWPRDWSSDVCSSDLDQPAIKLSLARVFMYTGQINDAKQLLMEARKKASSDPDVHRNLALVLQRLGESNQALRSEERRVGKECRSRW